MCMPNGQTARCTLAKLQLLTQMVCLIYFSSFLFPDFCFLSLVNLTSMVFEVKKKTRGQCQILQMCSGRLSVVDQYLEKIFFCLTKVNLLNWFTLRSRWLLLKMMSKGKVQLLWISKVLFTSNLLNLDINQFHWCPYRSIKYRLILRLQS